MTNINFTGHISPNLCKRLGISETTKLPGTNNILLTDIRKESVYNRYKYGIFHKPTSFRDYMESKTFAIFNNKNNPEKTVSVEIGKDLNIETPAILNNITEDIVTTAAKLLNLSI